MIIEEIIIWLNRFESLSFATVDVLEAHCNLT